MILLNRRHSCKSCAACLKIGIYQFSNAFTILLPICLTDMENPDLAMTLTVMDGYYLGNTCLTLEMAYLNARLLARPAAAWLTEQVM